MYSVVIKNGRVIDGSGNPWFKADIGLEGDRIARIGQVSSSGADRVIDANGMIVAPGFIDVHNHSDAWLFVNPRVESYVRQGVATICIGNCGNSAAPLKGSEKERTEVALKTYGITADWSTFGEFLKKLDSTGVSTNVVSMVGHGTIRSCVMGYAGRLPETRELEEMKNLVDQSMKDGAFGLSTGLAYAPGFFSDTREVKELCRVVAKHGGIYTTHIRNEVTRYKESVEEAIEIGRDTGIPVLVNHIESHYPAWKQTESVLKLVDEARERGLEVACDVPPYHYGATSLATLLPGWAQEGGAVEMKKRLKSPEIRKKIEHSVKTDEKVREFPAMWLGYSGYWDRIIVSDSRTDPSVAGETIEQIAKNRGVRPYDLVFDLLLNEEKPPSITYGCHDENDIRKVVTHPAAMIESDGRAYADYGVLAREKPHPRPYGTFALAFRKYVRGETREELPQEEGAKLLTVQELIRKITSFPAQTLRLRDRGMLREDFFADIVVFDLDKIEDLATYKDPHRYARGIRYLLVNGETVIDNDKHVGATPGKILRGFDYLKSR